MEKLKGSGNAKFIVFPDGNKFRLERGLRLHDYPDKLIAIMKLRIKKLGLKIPLPFEKIKEVAFTKTADIKEAKK